jgi:integrase
MHDEGTLQALTGGLKVKVRVQHPKILEAKFREGWMWFFRYYADEVQADGSVKTVRKKHAVGLSRGDDKITKKQAEIERDKFLAKQNAPTVEAAVQQVAATGVALFGEVAKMYEEGYLGRENQIAKPTRAKEQLYLSKYIVPKWGMFRLSQIRPQAIEDWLHTTFDSWWTMHGVRAIISRIYYYAEGHGFWEEGKRSPASKAKLGKRRYAYERRILSFEETARVLAHLEEPNRLIVETCIATGARISEVLGLKWKHVDLKAGTIKIEQRVWQQDVGRPKSEDSRRTLGLGDLVVRFREKAAADGGRASEFVFQQKRAPGKPLWDTGVRDALHQAAQAEGCDFPGLGLHSFRRANITWRQEVGGSAIEASKIAGHHDLKMTSAYTFVAPERQNELTRRIQQKLAEAAREPQEKRPAPEIPPPAAPPAPAAPPTLADTNPVTTVIQ